MSGGELGAHVLPTSPKFYANHTFVCCSHLVGPGRRHLNFWGILVLRGHHLLGRNDSFPRFKPEGSNGT